jgi:hypothetical protein
MTTSWRKRLKQIELNWGKSKWTRLERYVQDKTRLEQIKYDWIILSCVVDMYIFSKRVFNLTFA